MQIKFWFYLFYKEAVCASLYGIYTIINTCTFAISNDKILYGTVRSLE